MNPLTVTRMSGAGQGKPNVFERSPVSLGTAPGNDLKYDPTWDKTVSDRHAFLEWKDGRWIVNDAGSRDGTLVNGQRIRGPVPVGAGIEIELGAGGPRVKVADPAFAAAEARAREARPAGPVGAGASGRAKKSKPMPVAAIALVAVVAGLVAWLVWPENEKPAAATNVTPDPVTTAAAKTEDSRDFDERFAEVAKAHENCVGLVVMSGQNEEGKPTANPTATAWAVGKDVFATNSHVTQPLKEHLAGGGSAFVVLNKNPELRFRVREAIVHPRYGDRNLNLDGKDPAVLAYDVGLLRIEGEVPNHLKIARDAELEKLDSGYRVAYMGFPMEGIAGGGVDYHSPVATMQSGIVTSNTDYWLSKAQFPDRLLVAHNLGSAGGSSGSPVFNVRGEVVAILSAGNIIGQATVVDGRIDVVRAPSGVLINYAQRIDLLRTILPEYEDSLAPSSR